MFNKKVIISYATLTITNPKNVYKQKNSLLSHKTYYLANIKIEAI